MEILRKWLIRPAPSNKLWVLDPVDSASLQRGFDISFELGSVLAEHCGRFVIQRIVRIWLHKQAQAAHDDRVNIKYRLSIGTQQVQTHVALRVNIRVVDWRQARGLWRLNRVLRRKHELKLVLAALPETALL